MSKRLSRSHVEKPATARCDQCFFTFDANSSEFNADVYRAAKEHARDNPGHTTHASITREHSYVINVRSSNGREAAG